MSVKRLSPVHCRHFRGTLMLIDALVSREGGHQTEAAMPTGPNGKRPVHLETVGQRSLEASHQLTIDDGPKLPNP